MTNTSAVDANKWHTCGSCKVLFRQRSSLSQFGRWPSGVPRPAKVLPYLCRPCEEVACNAQRKAEWCKVNAAWRHDGFKR